MSTYYIKKKTRYKRHFICFKCRKNFKQPNEKDLAEKNGDYSLLMNAFYYFKQKKKISKTTIDYLNSTYFKNKVLCPQCREQMIEVPMSFETPPKKELKKWKSIETLYNVNGYVWYSAPEKKKELIEMLENSLEQAIYRAKNIEDFKKHKEHSFEARKRTNEVIDLIKNEINHLKNE